MENSESKSCSSMASDCEFKEPAGFWSDSATWVRACKNTLNCLIGCSIGDFGTIIWFQAYHPEVPILKVMPLAMVMGLLTSILFETLLLKLKEGFGWIHGMKVAFNMSFMGMLAMEFAENATDYLLTGGNVPMSEPFFWVALGIALIAGFLTPLPYKLL